MKNQIKIKISYVKDKSSTSATNPIWIFSMNKNYYRALKLNA